ncbi:MAG: NFACT family protein [Chloroflexi bacterium]|nr:NFACT family protein [Chloroflexota bacterium]
MSIDTFTTAALVDQFNAVLAGGKIQDTVEIERETFGFEIYNNQERHYLLLSADIQQPRALLSPEKLRRGVQTPSTLGLLLRNRVEGMRLTHVEQPPFDRIITFHLIGPDNEMQLHMELIERRANIILVEDGLIIDSARRVGGKENRYRLILPKHEYVPPPPQQGKLNPGDLKPDTIDSLMRRFKDTDAVTALVKGVLGMSPLLAQEIIFRAHKDVNIGAMDINPYTVHAAMTPLVPPLLRHQWQPGVGYSDKGLPEAVTVFPLTYIQWEPTGDVSAALNIFHGELEGPAAYEAAKIPIREQLMNAREKVRRKLYSLEKQNVDDSDVERLRQSGELILAYQYSMQKGQKILEAQYEVEGDPLQIKLNTELTPLENAQDYFEKYNNAKRARAQLPKLIAETRDELDYLDQVDADLDMAEDWQDIGEVQDFLMKNGYWQGKRTERPQTGKSAPLKFSTKEGFVIWVGRNSRQNEQVTWDKAGLDDLWLHARGIPGSHVVIKTNGQKVPEHVLEQAAGLAAYYSKARDENKVLVLVAERRYLRKPKRGKPGQVLVRQERPSLLVAPRADLG